MVKLVFQAMGSSLQAAITTQKLDEDEEGALVELVNLFGSPNQWNRFHNDVKIYMEACLAHARSGLPAQIQIMNDHKFFTMFLKSRVADDTIHSVVTDVLGIQEGVHIKLVAELIHGL